jgi:hypothetical protein
MGSEFIHRESTLRYARERFAPDESEKLLEVVLHTVNVYPQVGVGSYARALLVLLCLASLLAGSAKSLGPGLLKASSRQPGGLRPRLLGLMLSTLLGAVLVEGAEAEGVETRRQIVFTSCSSRCKLL